MNFPVTSATTGRLRLPSVLIITLLMSPVIKTYAQDLLRTQLTQSAQLHRIMKEECTQGGMNRWLQKSVGKSRDLPLAADFSSLKLTGPGRLSVDTKRTISGKGSVVIETPTSLGTKSPPDGSY